jgi:hypothetical protein
MPFSPQRQQSISYFFTQNTSENAPSVPRGSPSKHFGKQPTQKKRAADSAFVDLTLSDAEDGVPANKKLKSTDIPKSETKGRSGAIAILHPPQPATSLESNSATPSKQNEPNPSIAKYKLTQNTTSSFPEPEDPEYLRQKAARRNAFRRKLMNDSLNKRPEDQFAGTNDTGRDGRCLSDKMSDSEGNDEDSGEERSYLPTSISSKAFKSTKLNGKGKEKMTLSPFPMAKKRASEEIGPSGKTYTPLEKQVPLSSMRFRFSYSSHLPGQTAEG